MVFLVGNLHAGGLERFVTSVCLYALEHALFQPFVVCLAGKEGVFLPQLERAGITVWEAPAGWQRNPARNLELSDLLKDIGADVVHSQVNFSLLQQYLAVRRTGAGFMVTERNMYPLRGVSRLKKMIQYHLLKWGRVPYSANSLAVRDHLAALVCTNGKKIPVVHNGYALTNNGHRALSRRELGLPEEGFLIGYVARMAPHKGHLLFLNVLQELAGTYKLEVNACLVGDGPEKTTIAAHAARLGIANRVFFLGVRPDMERIYPLFDIQVLLSKFEGMPNVVIEGMSHGLPVVASRVGNVAELFEGGSGILIDNMEAGSIAQRIARLLTCTDKRRRIAGKARHTIASRYSLDSTVSELVSIYSRLV